MTAARSQPRLAWPLSGRSPQLDQLRRVIEGKTAEVGAVLVGDAGVGKSRLLNETLDDARRGGRTTVGIAATESSHAVPLSCLIGAFGITAAGESPMSQTTFIVDAERWLTESPTRVVVGIDDAHHLDDSAAALIHRLAARRHADFVITMRSGSTAPDAITALWKDRIVQRIDVPPLTADETRLMIVNAFGEPVASHTVSRLTVMSGRNPLYLRLLLEGGIESGWLRRTDGEWRWEGAAQLPASLRELVHSRIGAVPEGVQRILDLLSISEPLTLASMELLAGRGDLETAEQRGLVMIHRDGVGERSVKLGHPLFGEARRTATGVVRARRLRGELTRVLADPRSGHSHELLRRAALALDADGPPPSLELLIAGAQRAAELVDVPLAVRLARAAVAAGGGFQIQLVVASYAAVLSGEDPLAELDILDKLARDDAQRAGATLMRVSHLAWATTDPEGAQDVVRHALTVMSEPSARRQIVAIGSILDAHQSRFAIATRTAQDVLTDGAADPDAIIMAACAAVVCHGMTGSADRMRDVVGRALTKPTPLGNGAFRLPLTASHVLGLHTAGYLAESARVTGDLVQRIDRDGIADAVALYSQGAADLAAGRPATALHSLTTARDLLEPVGAYGGWQYMTWVDLVTALALAGDPAEAVRAASGLDGRAHRTMRWLDPYRVLAHAAVAARVGAVTEALARCWEAVRMSREVGQHATEVVALQRVIELGSTEGRDRLAELSSTVDGPRVRVALEHARALSAADTAGLIDAAERWAALGDRVAAAIAAAQAHRVGDAAGADPGTLRRYARRTAELVEQCEDANTPELRAFQHPLPLTPREREVVALLSLGLGNRAIAERLFVSVRTVEGHLYRAGAKLGMSRRQMIEASPL